MTPSRTVHVSGAQLTFTHPLRSWPLNKETNYSSSAANTSRAPSQSPKASRIMPSRLAEGSAPCKAQFGGQTCCVVPVRVFFRQRDDQICFRAAQRFYLD